MLTHKAINSLPSHCHLSGPAQALPGCCYRADALSCPQHGPAAAGQVPPAPTSHGAGAAPAHPAARSCHARPCCASPGVPGVAPGTRPSPGPAGLQRLHVPVEPVPGNPPEQVPPRSGLPPQTLLLGHRPARPCLPGLRCPGSHAGRSQALGPIPAALCTTRLREPRSCRTAGTSRGQQPAVHSPSEALLMQPLHAPAPAQQHPGCRGLGTAQRDRAVLVHKRHPQKPPLHQQCPPAAAPPVPKTREPLARGCSLPGPCQGPAALTLTFMGSTPGAGSPGQPAVCPESPRTILQLWSGHGGTGGAVWAWLSMH